jgi:hypothetical protein
MMPNVADCRLALSITHGLGFLHRGPPKQRENGSIKPIRFDLRKMKRLFWRF